jgi:hypothetical protein
MLRVEVVCLFYIILNHHHYTLKCQRGLCWKSNMCDNHDVFFGFCEFWDEPYCRLKVLSLLQTGYLVELSFRVWILINVLSVILLL